MTTTETSLLTWPLRALLFFLLLIASLPQAARAQAEPAEVDAEELRTLYDLDGRRHSLRKLPGMKAIVLAWTSEGCPMSKLYSPRLVEIARDFEERGVRFFVIDSSPQDSAEFLQSWAETHATALPLVRDEGGLIAAKLGVTRTTEVVVFDALMKERYRGAIDDQYGYDRKPDDKSGQVGTYRKEAPSRTYLRDGLEALLAGKAPVVARTEAWGCALGSWPKKSRVDGAPTYHQDVQPILERHCNDCHHRGGNAPFSLQSYRKASGWADTILEVIESGAMPPWNANPEHGEFSNARILAASEREILEAWIAADCPEGEKPKTEAARVRADHWTIGEPDLVLEVPAFDVPADGILPYQYFKVEQTFEEDTWLQAAEVRSTNSEVVHHVLMFLDSPWNRPKDAYEPWRPDTDFADLVQGTTREEAQEFLRQAGRAQRRTSRVGKKEDMEKAARLGYRQRMRTSRQNGLLGYFLSSLPGSNSRVFPEGQGKFIPKGSKVVFQFHFTPNGVARSTVTKLGLRFCKEAPKEVVNTHALTTLALRIPPGEANYERRVEFKIRREGKLLSLHPHMHYRGKSFRYELRHPNGETEILLDVPRYDFDWQHEYRLKEPKLMEAGSVLIGTAVYDNSAQNPYNPDPTEEVLFGLQSFEEMYVGYFSVIWDETKPILED